MIYPFPQKPGWKAWGGGGERRGGRSLAILPHLGTLLHLAFVDISLLLLGLSYINGNLKKRTDILSQAFVVIVVTEICA